jgi:hypothetical protein
MEPIPPVGRSVTDSCRCRPGSPCQGTRSTTNPPSYTVSVAPDRPKRYGFRQMTESRKRSDRVVEDLVFSIGAEDGEVMQHEPDSVGSIRNAGLASVIQYRRDVRNTTAITWRFQDSPPTTLHVGDSIAFRLGFELGLRGKRLTERHVVFLLLVLANRSGGLSGADRSQLGRQREAIRAQLRVRSDTFYAWLDRYVGFVPGSILKWARSSNADRDSARTLGPWRVVANRIELKPNPEAAVKLINRHVRDTERRSEDAGVLFRAALEARDDDQWESALELGHEAMRVYATKRLPRHAPEWHRIRLFVAQTEMQIGEEGLLPNSAVNVLRSVGKFGSGDHELMLVRGGASYVAALTSAQGNIRKPIETALSYLDRGIETLQRNPTAEAARERWRLAAFREELITNQRRIAQPVNSSAIIRASEEIDGSKEEKLASYGEMLVTAGQPARGLEYLIPALGRVPRIRSNAWVAAERAHIVGQWLLGARRSTALAALEAHASAIGRLGFQHQLRVTQAQIARVRSGIRSK